MGQPEEVLGERRIDGAVGAEADAVEEIEGQGIGEEPLLRRGGRAAVDSVADLVGAPRVGIETGVAGGAVPEVAPDVVVVEEEGRVADAPAGEVVRQAPPRLPRRQAGEEEQEPEEGREEEDLA